MKQAVVLAAGEGRRLKPFTINRTKAMLYVAGKPIIQYILEALVENNIRDIILIVGYHKEQICDFIGDGQRLGARVNYVFQSSQLGTGHALAQTANMTDEEFLVLAGDKLISPLALSQLSQINPPALLVRREDKPSLYGVATVVKGKLSRIVEKPVHPESNLINAGIYYFNREIFQFIDNKLDIPDILNEMVRQGKYITALETNRAWMDVIYPWDILILNAALIQRVPVMIQGDVEGNVSIQGQVSIGKGTRIHTNSCITGPVVIGEGCEIGPNVCIYSSTSLGNNIVIGPFTEIKNSIINDDVHIATGAVIQDSVIDRGCTIGGRFSAFSEDAEVTIDLESHHVRVGAMLGEGCHLGHNIAAQAGVIMGNYCQVKSSRSINGKIPDKSLVV